MEEFDDYYDILDVPSDATKEDIKRSYQSLALKFHPDKQNENRNGGNHCDKFSKMSKAWQVLSDADSRKKYDAQYCIKRLHQYSLVNEEVELSDMLYNEDTKTFSKSCRCGGEYVVSQCDVQWADCLISCDTCSLCVKVILRDAKDAPNGDVVEAT